MTIPLSQINRLMQQLAAAQLSAQAFAMQAEMVLEDLNKSVQEARAAETAEPTEAGCPHPMSMRDTSIRTMGHASRFQCRMCGAVVEDGTP